MSKELRRAPDSLSVWESNMRELEARQPNLAALLHNYVRERGHAFEHYENATPAGKWIEGLTDEPFFERDEEPKFNWSRKKREDKNKPVFMLYGIGTPPYLFKAIKALPDAALSMIVVEPNLGLLAYTLHLTHVYLALPQQCRLAFLTEGEASGETEEERNGSKALHSQALRNECLQISLQPVGIFAAALAEASAHGGESGVWEKKFAEMSDGVREWISLSLSALGNSAEDTMLGFRQIAIMAPMMSFGPKLSVLEKKYAGRPAVLVAAGPSLDKNFTLLRDIQDKCLIIAADAVLEKLLSNGIKPHVVTSLERGTLTYELFFSKNVDTYRDECRDILLVPQALCEPSTPSRWPGPVCLVCKMEVPSDSWIGAELLGGLAIMSGMSVAHLNYSVACYLGASSIAIIGQDLAYGDDGKSHAGSVGGSFAMNKSDAIPIPGALGGTVITTRIWLAFLRLLENYIRMFKVPTWDCTEGGALIASTTILPFKDFIEEHVTSLEPMEASPAEIVRDAYQNENFGEIRNIVLDRIERLHSLFDVFEKRLDEIEEMMESVTAPGLEPARRISYAAGVGNRLDGFHAASPVFDFIGQSYTRLASIELSNTRSLDDVDTVNRWYVIHKEIVDSHRAVVSFTRKWTTYAREAVNYWGGKGSLDLGPLDPEPAMERAEELLLKLGGEPEDAAHVWFELDKVMTRCDPVLLKWPGHILWNYAMLLMKEGRAARASRFMQAAAEGFDGHEMLSSDMVAFFKDYARVLMEHDLVHTPDYLRAEVMLANAAEIGGVDDEIRSILSELLDTEVSMTAILDEVSGLKGSNSTVGWFKERAAAQRELYEGDLKRALVTVWRAVSKHWKSVPGWAASHLDWLAATLEKCVQAGDPLLAETACGIISEMAASEDLMTAVRIPYSETFAELLKEKGLSVALLVVKKKQDAEDNPDESDEPPGDEESDDENMVGVAASEDEKSF